MSTAPVVRRQRTISATPHEVCRAWLESDLLRRWLAPGELEVPPVSDTLATAITAHRPASPRAKGSVQV